MIEAALLGSAALGAGGSIFSSVFGSSAASKQANAIKEAAKIAQQTAYTLDERQRADLAPFRQYGIEAGDTLMNILLRGGNVSDVLKESDLYKFQSELGTRDINRQLSARGLYGSGKGLETLSMFTKGLVAEEGQRFYDRLFGVTGLGENAAARTAANTSGIGQTLLTTQAQLGSQYGQALSNQYNAIGGIGPGVAGAVRGGVGDYLTYSMFNNLFPSSGQNTNTSPGSFALTAMHP